MNQTTQRKGITIKHRLEINYTHTPTTQSFTYIVYNLKYDPTLSKMAPHTRTQYHQSDQIGGETLSNKG